MGDGPLLIRGMWGLGDNIYQRGFVREIARRREVYLETPWPELYLDLPVRFVRGMRNLRTQTKNIARQPSFRWTEAPAGIEQVRIGYGRADLARGSIVQAMAAQFGFDGSLAAAEPLVFDLPDMGPAPVLSDRPIAVVRPVTIRREWRNEARNPLPEYVAFAAQWLSENHYVVAIADVEGRQEWACEPLPPHDAGFLHGELQVRELLALVASADVVVGGVGWIVPAAIALKTKAFVVLGGHGGHNAPEKIIDPRMDASRIGFAMPDRLCRCTDMLHRCDKTISDLPSQFAAWRDRVGLRCSARSPAVA